jgi:hypothetical protein
MQITSETLITQLIELLLITTKEPSLQLPFSSFTSSLLLLCTPFFYFYTLSGQVFPKNSGKVLRHAYWRWRRCSWISWNSESGNVVELTFLSYKYVSESLNHIPYFYFHFHGKGKEEKFRQWQPRLFRVQLFVLCNFACVTVTVMLELPFFSWSSYLFLVLETRPRSKCIVFNPLSVKRTTN